MAPDLPADPWSGEPAAAPNMLFFFPDQHRPDWIGVNPDVPVDTPNLDWLIGQGVRFPNAVTPAPVCAPARGCLVTGTSYDHNPVKDNADTLPPDAVTYVQRLREEAGYHTMGCGKFDLHKGAYSWGVDGTHRLEEWGFSDGIDNAGKLDGVLSLKWDDHPRRLDESNLLERAIEATLAGDGEPAEPYTAYLEREGLLETYVRGYAAHDRAWTWSMPEEAYIDNWIARRGLELLDRTPHEQPWHCMVNFAGPHSPFDVTGPMHDWYNDPPVTFPDPIGVTANETDQHIRRHYAAMIRNIDRWLGRYLAELRDRGTLANTIVVFASDHGELLGDHGHWGKGLPYQASVGVPLVMAGPGIDAQPAIEDPVTLLDLHDTFLEAAGLEGEMTDSTSLWPVVSGCTTTHREVVTAGLNEWRLAFDGRYKLIDNWVPAGVDEAAPRRTLFDLETDPQETCNLRSRRPDVVDRLASSLPEPSD